MAGETPKDNADYEVVKPPRDLRSKVRVLSGREAARFDPIKAAEEALVGLSGEFDGWMGDEVATLQEAWRSIEAKGMSKERCDALFRAAHDIKGQAGTLGYPLVGTVAANLCHLIENVVPPDDIPIQLVEQHVEAVRAMVAERARDTDNAVGRALAERLALVTDEFIADRRGPAAVEEG